MKRNTRFLLILALMLPAPEAAAQYSMAVLGVDMGGGPADRAECLANGLKRQVKQAPGFDLVPGKNLDEIKMVFGCFNEAAGCMAKAGESLQVEKLLWGRLEKARGGYTLSILMLDVKSARVEKSAREQISRSDLGQSCAAEVVSRLAVSLLFTRRATLTINVNVDGARVSVGPRFIGLSEGGRPIKRDMLPGAHNVQVTANGYQDWTHTVNVKAGEERVLEVALQPMAGAPITDPGVTPVVEPEKAEGEGSSNLGWKIAFWGSAAATVGMAIGLGVTGSQVLGLQEEKEDLVNSYRDRMGNPQALPPSHDDICSDPRNAPGGASLEDGEVADLQRICDDGQSKALATNVLIGTTIAVAALTGFLYYKAYIARSDEEEKSDEGDVEVEQTSAKKDRGLRWAVSPAAGPGGASLGFTMQF